MAMNKFIYCTTLAVFNTALGNGTINNSNIVFIEETRQLWTHEKFYSCYYTKEQIDTITSNVTSVTNRVKSLENAKGAKSGIATLDSNGKLTAAQIPASVTDVYEGTYSNSTTFNNPSGTAYTGQSGKIYVDTTSKKIYRYTGTSYVEISVSLALGETSTTAYAGDKGKTLATNLSAHTSNTSNPHGVTAEQVGLGKVENKTSAEIRAELTKSDVTTALGYTPPTTNTTYNPATQSANGLMSSTDKKKLDGIEAGAQKNTITGIKGSSESTYRTGNVNITAANIGLGNVTNESKATMFTNAALTGTPTAPTAAQGTDTTQIATTAYVIKEINTKLAAADAMIFKGTVNDNADLPAAHTLGWTYKVATAGTYAGYKCEVGDMIVCITTGTEANNAHWTVIQSNIDGAVTGPASAVTANIAVFDGTSGKVIKDGGITVASLKSYAANPDNLSKAVPVSKGGTGATTAEGALTNLGLTATATELNYMDGVTSNVQTQLDGKSATGHTHNYAGSSSAGGAANSVKASLTLKVKTGTTEGTDLYTFNGSTAKSLDIKQGTNVTLTAASGSLTIASTDTKNTAGSSNSTAKLFLVGAASQAASAQTYSNSSCYASGGYLYSGGTKVSVEGHNHDSAYLKLSGGSLSGSLTATSFVKSGGTSSQILMADGSTTSVDAYWSGEWVELS